MVTQIYSTPNTSTPITIGSIGAVSSSSTSSSSSSTISNSSSNSSNHRSTEGILLLRKNKKKV